MSNKKQSRANRKNGRLGKGKKTPQGIEISKWNAFKYGGRCLVVLLPWEDRNEFWEHCSAFIRRYAPWDMLELKLVLRIAGNDWRRDRMVAYETWVFQQPELYGELSRELNWVSLHENRLQKNTEKTIKELLRLQAQRLEEGRESLADLEMTQIQAAFEQLIARPVLPPETAQPEHHQNAPQAPETIEPTPVAPPQSPSDNIADIFREATSRVEARWQAKLNDVVQGIDSPTATPPENTSQTQTPQGPQGDFASFAQFPESDVTPDDLNDQNPPESDQKSA